MSYKQLIAADRQRIEIWLGEGHSQSEVARKLGVNRSTISREVGKQNTPSGYSALSAQVRHETRRSRCRPAKKIEETALFGVVVKQLRRGWSPEGISGRIEREIEQGVRLTSDQICHETIYRFVYHSPFGKREKLYEYLRRGKKHRTHRRGRKSQREIIPNRVFIDKRSLEIAERTSVGHWEGDSIIYPDKQAINSLLERKSRYTLLTKLQRKTAELTKMAVTTRLVNHHCSSLTLDNGAENVRHEEIAKILQAKIYFCHPYHSWEKGSVENINGCVRRYFPRGVSIETVTQTDLDDVAWELNNRPRKVLGYATPTEVLESEYIKLGVAVRMRM